MLKRLRRFLSPSKLRLVMEGVFSSKLIYGMTVWGRVWGIPGSLDEETRTSRTMTKEDLRKLQVLQNKCMRLVTNSEYRTPTEHLLLATGSLSVHQRIAQLSLAQIYTISCTKKPTYHYNRLFGNYSGPTMTVPTPTTQPDTRSARQGINRIEFRLSQARASFFYQASRLWSALPEEIRTVENKAKFKRKSKAWVKSKILIKP